MTSEETKSLKKVILLSAAYYGRELRDEVVAMMSQDLEDLSLAAVSSAYQAYRRNPKNKTFPLPAQIREIVAPVRSPEAEARAIASRVTESITRFGWSNAPEAKLYIGEIGWSLVQGYGGWSYLCQNHGLSIDPTAFDAQIRNRALDAVQFGINPSAYVALEHARSKQLSGGLEKVGNILKLFKKPEDEK